MPGCNLCLAVENQRTSVQGKVTIIPPVQEAGFNVIGPLRVAFH